MSLRCVAADSIYANNANRKFSMQEVSTLISKGYKIAKRFSKEEKSYIISQGYEVS